MRTFFGMLMCVASLAASGELSGRRAPGFALPDMNFKYYDPQDYRGKILLIEIMQTNCEHCKAFSSILVEVAEKYRGQVVVLMVVNPPDNTATVRRYIAEKKISVPVLFDCSQMAASYLKATPQHSEIHVPHLFIVDAKGMIANDYSYSPLTQGIFEGRELFNELDGMLAKSH